MATLSVPDLRSAAALARPLGKAPEPFHDEASGGKRPLARSMARAWTEVGESFARIDPRRLLWSVGAVIPDFTFPCARARLLALVGCDVAWGTGVLGHVDLIGPPGSARNLRIGTGSTICPNARFWLDGAIILGKNVTIGPDAMLCTATHPIGGPSRRMQSDVAPRPIVIDDGAWIGLGAMILPGVRVGRGAIVGAGAVVRGDVPQDVIVAGNPAAIVRRLPVR